MRQNDNKELDEELRTTPTNYNRRNFRHNSGLMTSVETESNFGEEPLPVVTMRRDDSEVSSTAENTVLSEAIYTNQAATVQEAASEPQRISLVSPSATTGCSDEAAELEERRLPQLYRMRSGSRGGRYSVVGGPSMQSESDTPCMSSFVGKPWEYYYRHQLHCDTDTTMDDDHGPLQGFLLGQTAPYLTQGQEERSGSSPVSIEMRSASFRSYVTAGDPGADGDALSGEKTLANSGTLVKQSDGATDANSVMAERMKYESPEDPRNYIINIIANNEPGRVTLQFIHEELNWDERFAEANGSVLEYLQGYQFIFAVSPLDDRVTMRRPLKAATGRRRLRGQSGYRAMSNRIGSVSCSYVARKFDLELLSALYKRRGYRASIIYDVLHVSSFDMFDLFLFPSGVVVWWGMNRCDHWLVEDDFLSKDLSFVSEAIQERHSQKSIDELFPMWYSYELDENYDSTSQSAMKQSLERFSTNLCFEHYLIPSGNPLRTQVMLTVSYSLGRISVVDFFDNLTHLFHKKVLQIPSEIRGFFDYFSAQRQITCLEGELHIAIMAITEFFDTPDFLWEMAWLHDYYEIAERQNSSENLFSWFIAKSDALLQQLANIKGRRHRLFILGSDVILIMLLVADVIFLMASFILRLYFPLEEK